MPEQYTQNVYCSSDQYLNANQMIVNANITGQTQQVALRFLEVRMKQTGLWDKFHCIYPMIGGTVNTHKWNLKDVRDTNDAYRLTLTTTHTDTFSGSSSTWKTHYIVPTLNDCHFSYFSMNDTGNNTLDFGALWAPTDVGSPQIGLLIKQAVNNRLVLNLGDSNIINTGAGALNSIPATTLFTVSRSSNTSTIIYSGATSIFSNLTARTLQNAPQTGMALNGYQDGGGTVTPQGFRVCSFFTMGLSLTPSEISTYTNIVYSYQRVLGRVP